MPIAAVAIVGAVVAGAAIAGSGGSSINAQRAQAIALKAQEDALAESEEGFQFIEDELRPLIDIGTRNLETLDQELDELTRPFELADFEADPGFQFRIEQGEKGINNFLASRGLAKSGRAGKELARFNQGEATQEFDRAFNRFQLTQGNRFGRLLTLANVGQQNINTLVSARENKTARNVNTLLGTGENVAQLQVGIGEIENAARARRGEAIAGAATSISNTIASGGAAGGGGFT